MAAQSAADIEIALRAAPAAHTAFTALRLSHKTEYLRWLDEAMKPETRQRRIASMIDRLTKKAER